MNKSWRHSIDGLKTNNHSILLQTFFTDCAYTQTVISMEVCLDIFALNWSVKSDKHLQLVFKVNDVGYNYHAGIWIQFQESKNRELKNV